VDVTILTREITPFEHLVAKHLCEGLSNAAIAEATAHTEKVVENTVSRLAKVFSLKSAPDINIRVLLALAYRANFGDAAFDQLGIPCKHLEQDSDGRMICSRHLD
jgi:DNA-binding CsgD family transcriptional regulator